MDGFTRKIIINVTKSLDSRMKVKDKQEKKKVKYFLFSILN